MSTDERRLRAAAVFVLGLLRTAGLTRVRLLSAACLDSVERVLDVAFPTAAFLLRRAKFTDSGGVMDLWPEGLLLRGVFGGMGALELVVLGRS